MKNTYFRRLHCFQCCYVTDIIGQFFLAKTDVLKQIGAWDDSKMVIDHDDFFLRVRIFVLLWKLLTSWFSSCNNTNSVWPASSQGSYSDYASPHPFPNVAFWEQGINPTTSVHSHCFETLPKHTKVAKTVSSYWLKDPRSHEPTYKNTRIHKVNDKLTRIQIHTLDSITKQVQYNKAQKQPNWQPRDSNLPSRKASGPCRTQNAAVSEVWTNSLFQIWWKSAKSAGKCKMVTMLFSNM